MNDSKCLFCGGGTIVTMKTRKLGSTVVTETRKCKECKRHSLKVRAENGR